MEKLKSFGPLKDCFIINDAFHEIFVTGTRSQNDSGNSNSKYNIDSTGAVGSSLRDFLEKNDKDHDLINVDVDKMKNSRNGGKHGVDGGNIDEKVVKNGEKLSESSKTANNESNNSSSTSNTVTTTPDTILVAVTYAQIDAAISAQREFSEMYRTDKQYISCVFLAYSENVTLKPEINVQTVKHLSKDKSDVLTSTTLRKTSSRIVSNVSSNATSNLSSYNSSGSTSPNLVNGEKNSEILEEMEKMHVTQNNQRCAVRDNSSNKVQISSEITSGNTTKNAQTNSQNSTHLAKNINNNGNTQKPPPPHQKIITTTSSFKSHSSKFLQTEQEIENIKNEKLQKNQQNSQIKKSVHQTPESTSNFNVFPQNSDNHTKFDTNRTITSQNHSGQNLEVRNYNSENYHNGHNFNGNNRGSNTANFDKNAPFSGQNYVRKSGNYDRTANYDRNIQFSVNSYLQSVENFVGGSYFQVNFGPYFFS